MQRAIILHGMPSEKSYYNLSNDSQSNAHWLPWLQQQLCANDILAQTPEMPHPYQPDYAAWKTEIDQYVIDAETTLIGHSCGAGFWLRWLSENPNRIVKKVIAVAPWLDREKEHGSLFDFTLNPALVSQTTDGIDLLYSTNDGAAIQTTLTYLKDVMAGVNYHKFIDYGHFCLPDMKTREFPELLAMCTGR